MTLLTELRRRNVVRVTAAYLVVGWLLTEVLTTILPTLGAPEWTARAVILVFALGFLPAVALAWIYQITPEGIKRDFAQEPGARATPGSRAFDYMVVASVVVLVLVLAVLGSQPDTSDSAAPIVNSASVAVLPFEDMSPDKDHDYLADGLTETLLHMLAQIPTLQVAARTSSFAFKGQSMDIRQIAQTLQVAHVLEGSVQRSGDKVRVTAQLIRADDGFHVFSSTFDRQIDDIFAIQDEIAMRVRAELSASILGSPAVEDPVGAGTRNAEAYELFLQAMSETSSGSVRGLKAAERLLKGALAIDPGYLDAKTELAHNYLRQYENGLVSARFAAPQIRAMTSQVLEASPHDVGASAVRLYVQANTPMANGELVTPDVAIARFEILLGAHPNDYRVRSLLGRLLRTVGEYDKAVEIQQAALKNDSLNAQIHYELGSVYAHQGKLDAARKAFQRSLEIDPGQPDGYVSLARLSRQEGDAAGYARLMLKALQVDPQDHDIAGALAIFLYRLGLLPEGDEFRDRVLAIAPTSEAAYRIERVRAVAAGDQTAAVAAARRALEDDIGNRLSGYFEAVQYLLRVAVTDKRVEQELDYLHSVAPGITDFDKPAPTAKILAARIAALDGWSATLTPEALTERIQRLRKSSQSTLDSALNDVASVFHWLVLQRDYPAAVDSALQNTFSQSVLLNLDWPERTSLPQYGEFLDHAGIQAALAQWEREVDAARRAVTELLAELGAQG